MNDVSWIKITTDIFDNEKIKLLETMPDGDTLIIIWFKLITLAGKKNAGGMVYVTSEIPFTPESLSVVFSRPLNTVKLALKCFIEFKMIEVVNDFYQLVNWEKYQNEDGLMKIREQGRLRAEKHREKMKLLANNNAVDNVTVTLCNATDKEEELDKDKELKKDNHGKSYSESFLQFYEQYPKKKGKDQASRTFNGLIRAGVEYDYIIKCLENYKEEIHNKNTGYDYIKFPSSFLNCLSDYEEEPYSQNSSSIPKTNTEPAADVTCCGQKYSHEIGFCKVCGKSYNRDGSER